MRGTRTDRWRRAGLGRVLLVGVVGMCSPARAQDDEPSDSEIAAAREAFLRGVQAARTEQWEQARKLFARSYSLYPRPRTLLNLAGARAQTGRLVAAAESYRDFLRQASSEDSEYLDQAKDALERLRTRIPHIRIEIQGLNPDDTLRLDGETIRPAVLGGPLPVDPGRHVLRIERDGDELAQRRFSADEGEESDVTLELEPDPSDTTGDRAAANGPTHASRGGVLPPASGSGRGYAPSTPGARRRPEDAPGAERTDERGEPELLFLSIGAGAPIDDANAQTVGGGLTGLGFGLRPFRVGERSPFALSLVLGTALTGGAWRSLPAMSLAVEAGLTLHYAAPVGARVSLLYTPAFVLAEGRRHFTAVGYRASAAVQIRRWAIGASWQELRRDADSTWRPLLLFAEVEL